MTKPSVDLKNRYLAALLAWMVPGLGHFYQGRTGKGLLYGACILGLFVLGLGLGDWRIVYWRWVSPTTSTEQFCFNYIGQFFAGLAALPALIQATLKWYGQNPILWGFMAEPSDPNEMNAPLSPARQARRGRHALHDRRRPAQHPGDLRRLRRARRTSRRPSRRRSPRPSRRPLRAT